MLGIPDYFIDFRTLRCPGARITVMSGAPITRFTAVLASLSRLKPPASLSSPCNHGKISKCNTNQYIHEQPVHCNMSRPVEQALNTIIPRRSGALPAELIELANSLLAQSRNKCSNLKAEEEVARTYACANLACERYDLYSQCLSA